MARLAKGYTPLPTHNLPVQPTSFIGREKEISELKGLLEHTHLLTLTGPGGCGATRLSLKVAEKVLEQFSDGVWLVELAALADPALVPQAVANVLEVREVPGTPLLQTLVGTLKPKTLLLILDNCEHLLSACASLADAILHACPHVKILASSREGLGIAGETVCRIPSLSLEGGATFAWLQGDHPAAALLASEEVMFARQAQDRCRLAYALGHMASVALFRGDLEEANACTEEGMALAQEEGDRWLIGRHFSNLGLIAWMRQDFGSACSWIRQSVEITRVLGEEWMLGIALGLLALVARRAGDCVEARMLHHEGLSLFQRLGNHHGIGCHLAGVAGVEVERGRADHAARLLGAAAAVLETLGAPLPPPHQMEHDRTQKQTQALLGEAAFSAAWAEGRAMTVEQAIEYALEAPDTEP